MEELSRPQPKVRPSSVLPPGACPEEAAAPDAGAVEPSSAALGEKTGRLEDLVHPGSAKDFLDRLVPGDPLGVLEFAVDAVHRRALFLDPERVALRSLAHVAYRLAEHAARVMAGAVEEGPDIDALLRAAVSASIEELCEEERATWLSTPRSSPASEAPRAVRELARPLGLDVADLGPSCAGFHALPDADRQAFFRLVLEGQAPERVVGRDVAHRRELALRARRALDVLRGARAPERKRWSGDD